VRHRSSRSLGLPVGSHPFTALCRRSIGLATAFALAACGATPSGAGSSGEVRGTNAANIAQQASDPRTSDATAAQPARMSPPPGNAALGSSGSTSTPNTSPTTSTGTGSADPGAPAFGAKSNADPPTKIGARHVLIQWMGSERAPSSVVRSREQALAVAQEVLRRARNKEDFARLAVEFSDEPGAGGRGGSLGRFGHGQMVGAFEAAAFKLEIGQISDIVETPFGFHIIQRTE
jgi:hypothetical protein